MLIALMLFHIYHEAFYIIAVIVLIMWLIFHFIMINTEFIIIVMI